MKDTEKTTSALATLAAVTNIPLTQIKPSPFNYRTTFDRISELAGNIAAHGRVRAQSEDLARMWGGSTAWVTTQTSMRCGEPIPRWGGTTSRSGRANRTGPSLTRRAPTSPRFREMGTRSLRRAAAQCTESLRRPAGEASMARHDSLRGGRLRGLFTSLHVIKTNHAHLPPGPIEAQPGGLVRPAFRMFGCPGAFRLPLPDGSVRRWACPSPLDRSARRVLGSGIEELRASATETVAYRCWRRTVELRHGIPTHGILMAPVASAEDALAQHAVAEMDGQFRTGRHGSIPAAGRADDGAGAAVCADVSPAVHA
jgi:hypothetical protein